MNVGPPRPASTVVLLKPSARRFDVCLVRRHDEVAFMGGAYVFPGGRVDSADRLVDPDVCCDGYDAAIRRMPDLAPFDAVGHHVAAIREMFEEAGVLLARREGRLLGGYGKAEADRFADHRAKLLTGATTMGEIAHQEKVRLALDELALFAHWLTPEIEIKRYDARFFLARAPEGQEPVHDDQEITETLWIDPADAVDRCRRDEIMLPPPTWTALRTLERFTSVDEAMQWASRSRAGRVSPRLFEKGTQRMLALPGDELYPPVDGFETPRETRFRFENGRWKAIEI